MKSVAEVPAAELTADDTMPFLLVPPKGPLYENIEPSSISDAKFDKLPPLTRFAAIPPSAPLKTYAANGD